MHRLIILTAAAAAALLAADPLHDSTQHKLDLIESGQAKPGSVITFTAAEINAWARVEVPEIVPEGIRGERVELGTGAATAYALVDFLRMRQAKGQDTNWLFAKLIQGERPIKISVRLTSGGGRCTVYLTSVEVSDTVVSGAALDFLIKTFFLPLYPDAKINEPFELGDNIERIDIRPAVLTVVIKK
jgi:hypothetical protein